MTCTRETRTWPVKRPTPPRAPRPAGLPSVLRVAMSREIPKMIGPSSDSTIAPETRYGTATPLSVKSASKFYTMPSVRIRRKSERHNHRTNEKNPSVMALTEAGFHPPLLLKPLGDLLEIRRVAFLIGSRVPLGESRYGRTGVATRTRPRSPAPREPRLRNLTS